jgi:hypothetical protein
MAFGLRFCGHDDQPSIANTITALVAIRYPRILFWTPLYIKAAVAPGADNHKLLSNAVAALRNGLE